MGMNLECMLYLQKQGLLAAKKNRLLDIGPQNVYHCTVTQIREFVSAQGGDVSSGRFDKEAKRLEYFSTPRPEERTTLFSEIADLTNIEYNAFDVCPAFKTELLDLNFDALPKKYREYYDVVLNFGTTEHVFNQWNSFEVMHESVKVGGVMYCVLPASGYLDHGYYCYTPLFFRDLAQANGYQLIDLFLAPAGENRLGSLGLDVRSETEFHRPHSAKLAANEDRIPCFNIHAVMRKTQSAEFRCALEIATAHSQVNTEMAARYGHTQDQLHSDMPLPEGIGDIDELSRRLHHEKALRAAERDFARTQRDALASALVEVHASRSWRLTRPLRAVASILRGQTQSNFNNIGMVFRGGDIPHLPLAAPPFSGETEIQAETAKKLEHEKNFIIAERDRAITERDELRSQLAGAYASRSWRITKPLRNISTRLRQSKNAPNKPTDELIDKNTTNITKSVFQARSSSDNSDSLAEKVAVLDSRLNSFIAQEGWQGHWLESHRWHAVKELSMGVAAIYGYGIEGDVVEFGTMSGVSAVGLARAIARNNEDYREARPVELLPKKNLFLFDSFEGLPPTDDQVDRDSLHVKEGTWAPGTCRGISKEELGRRVGSHLKSDRVRILAGWFKDTVPDLPPNQKFGLIHVDGDLYSSTMDCLLPLFERGMVAEGALIYFDDWSPNRCSPLHGERRAWSELVERFTIECSDDGSYSLLARRFVVHSYRGMR